VTEAFLWGLVGGSSLMLGGIIALRAPITRRHVGLIMAFGAGVLLSAVAVLIWTTAALVVLGRAGFLWSGRGVARFYRRGTWVVAAGSALGSLANFASQSRYENFILGPLALALAILCVVVARSQLE
jgi:hypothetical protein